MIAGGLNDVSIQIYPRLAPDTLSGPQISILRHGIGSGHADRGNRIIATNSDECFFSFFFFGDARNWITHISEFSETNSSVLVWSLVTLQKAL